MGRPRLLAFALTGAALALGGSAYAMQSASPTAAAGDPGAGKQVFDHWCAPCHGRGPNHPGTQSLAVKYHGSPPAALEDRSDLSPATTTYFVRHGVSLMPFFRKTEVSDKDLRDLAAHLAKHR